MTVQKGGWDFFQEGKAGMGDASDDAVTDSSGNPAVNVVAEVQPPQGTLETITFTCNAATDAITDLTAPATAEICWASGFTAGAKRARFVFHAMAYNGTVDDLPHAVGALVSVNATTEATYISRFTTPDQGPQAAARTAFKERDFISAYSPVAEFDFSGTDNTVADVGVGFILPTGTGLDAVYVDVKVW